MRLDQALARSPPFRASVTLSKHRTLIPRVGFTRDVNLTGRMGVLSLKGHVEKDEYGHRCCVCVSNGR